ncbi:integrase core domain-containing protein [Nannocystis punicea]|uniref:integrase core domain-containing protein n=1 Tax=Nannocystis punicea TaxID=2995304 RepID=UPI0035309A67
MAGCPAIAADALARAPRQGQRAQRVERWHKTFKSTALRPAARTSIDDARRVTADFVEHYNARRLHSAIGYIAPNDNFAGREAEIVTERDRKLEAASDLRRRLARQHLCSLAPRLTARRSPSGASMSSPASTAGQCMRQ